MKVRGVVKGGGQEGPGPLIFGTRESKCVFYKGTIKVSSGVLDSVFGPPCLARHTWQCPCISLVLEATHARGEPRALEGHRLGRKSPSRVRDGDKLLDGRNGQEKCFLYQEVIDLPSKQIYDFTQKRKQKKLELVARPVLSAVTTMMSTSKRPIVCTTSSRNYVSSLSVGALAKHISRWEYRIQFPGKLKFFREKLLIILILHIQASKLCTAKLK